MQQNSSRYSDKNPSEPVRVAVGPAGRAVRRRAVLDFTSRLSPRQHSALLPRSRVAVLERNRGSQHVPDARQSLQCRTADALRPQSCCRRLGSVFYLRR